MRTSSSTAPTPSPIATFLRDVCGFAFVDAGGGWLIFQLPPSEVAVHPAEASGAAELYLVCDDIEATVAEFEGRGVVFEGAVSDQGWGRLATIRLPGGSAVGRVRGEARHRFRPLTGRACQGLVQICGQASDLGIQGLSCRSFR